MTTPTPTVYRSRWRTNRRRLLVTCAVLALVLIGFLVGRLQGGSPAAGSGPLPVPSSVAASSPTAPSQPPSRPAPAAPAGVDAYAPIQVETPAEQSGVEMQDTEDRGGGRNAGWIADGDWLRYDDIDFGAQPAVRMVARVASQAGDGVNGRVDIRLDDRGAAPIGSLPVTNTGGWQNWINQATDIAPTSGVHTLFLTFAADRGDDFVNLNYITFEH